MFFEMRNYVGKILFENIEILWMVIEFYINEDRKVIKRRYRGMELNDFKKSIMYIFRGFLDIY